MIPRLFGLDSNWNGPTDDIWFTRQIREGQLTAWALTVKFWRIEFGLQRDGQTYNVQCRYQPKWDNETVWSQNGPGPGYDGTWTTRIGWTRLGRLKIESHFDDARSSFPRRLSWLQCQSLLHGFVNRIVDRPDVDWRWFADNVNPACRGIEQLPPPPAALQNHVWQANAPHENSPAQRRKKSNMIGILYTASFR
ncbi:uncharacterized protein K489DRAFT_369119 [Dissoconium aciculare CBS 342.82]|uniref:Uncharacterized protein n=1 Tax=Dissoconium aciculare CBS 342.82 TaxID=1314786 RepID=A0A6J3MBJ7_9PEZI|nr:uncharacterized protein K489DRAFT_369119 [Dissoconium aciculare CBS 342.82]KAF1824212.1 hypothetical protein K489DRAFT_369119 [Dissoconium aciculare CBS 342.82]